MGFYSKNTPGRLDEKLTVGTVEDFRGDFEAGMSRRRKYRFPELPLEKYALKSPPLQMISY